MANSGIGNKFVSVNLNKSYGQPTGLGSGHSSNGRPRPASHGGMVVLSRPRTQIAGQKGSKLAVPPPLNLPSLRREHAGNDPTVGHSVGGGGSGSGALGWIKPPLAHANVSQDGEQNGSAVESAVGRSDALSADSMWGASIPAASHPAVDPNGELKDATRSSLSSGGRPNVYMPPAARTAFTNNGPVAFVSVVQPVEKAMVLRGEDFPSLQASLPHAPVPQQKQKDLQQKQRQNQEDLKEQKLKLQQISEERQRGLQDEVLLHQKGSPELQSTVPMRPQLKPRQPQNLSRETAQAHDRSETLLGHHPRKSAGYMAGPPLLLRLNHTSNWADDERDTGQSLLDRDRERDFSRNESHNNGNIGYGLPTFQKNGSFHSMAPYREGRDGGFFMDGRYGKEIDSGKLSFKDSFRGDSYGRETLPIAEDRDGNFRRGLAVRREPSFSGDMGFNRDGGFVRPGDISRESGVGRESGREIKIDRSSYGRAGGHSWETENGRESFTGRDSSGRDGGNWGLGFRDPYSRDGSYNREGQNGNFSRDGIGRKGLDQIMAKGVYGDTFGRNRNLQNDGPQSGALNKAAFSVGSRGMPVNDPILDFGREKRSFSSFGKPYSEDPFMKDFANIPGFDLRDPFGGAIGPEIKVLKRKKDNSKQTDFYDPIRESFEAELERVQKMQEQERQRIVEEQERAQELARKQEEERKRLAREEEERQRRLEEEAREAAWRAEQEVLEAAKRLEDERRAREEEKRRIVFEEERRKEAARQKLLELEERIAKRQAGNKKEEEVPKTEVERPPVGRLVKERDGLQRIDAGEWEDEERMVDRITSSASSESSSLSRSFETGSRSRDGNAFASDRIKHLNPWRRETSENGNGVSFMSQMIAAGEEQSDNYQSANQGPLRGGRGLPRRDLFEGVRSGSGKILRKTGGLELMHTKDNMPYLHEQRWNPSDDNRQHSRISDVGIEFLENSTEKYGDIEWGQDKVDHWRARGSPYIPSTMPYLQSSEADAFAFGRSRHSVRQPRVLPPPSMTALQKSIFKNGAEKPVSSPLLDEEPKSCHAEQDTERKVQLSLEQENVMQKERLEAATLEQDGHVSEEQQEPKSTMQSESQSLPSVSSAPGTPAHVSHDDLEDVESPTFQQNEGELAAVSDQGHSLIIAVPAEELKSEVYVEYDVPDLKSVRQEKHEEWVIEDDDEFAEEEDYDEEEQAYQEEDEVYEEEEEDVEEDREYEDVYVKEHALEAKNDQQDMGTDERVKGEESVVADFEEVAATDENESELQGISDNSVHQGVSFESGLLLGSEDDEHEVTLNHDGETLEMQKDIIEEGQGSEEVQEQMILQSVVQQDPMTSPSVLAPMDPMQLGQSDVQNSRQSSIQLLEQPVSATSVSLPQANVSAPSSLVPSSLTPISAHPSQPEMPIKLQFGLFPGPPLLPATVPAIQIGSIQMPLHLHPQVGPSLTQIHPSQPPMFQFGQIRYPAPISQGLLPLTQQPMPYVQTTVSAHYSLGQPVLSLSTQQTQNLLLGEPSVKELPQNNQSMIQEESVPQALISAQINNHTTNASQASMNGVGDPLLVQGNTEPVSTAKLSPGYWNVSSLSLANEQIKCSLPASEMETQLYHGTEANKNQKAAADRVSLKQNQSEDGIIQTSSSGRIFTGLQVVGMAGRGRGSRISHGSRSGGYGASMLPSESMWAGDSSRFHKQSRRNIHRREFRVRESIDRTQLEGSGTNTLHRQEEKSQISVQQDLGSSSANRGKKDFGLSVDKLRPSESSLTSNSGTGLYSVQYESKVDKVAGGKTTRKSGVHGPILNSSRSTEGILGRHETLEVAVDAPLQSGIVRIFKQSGIETPSDEDDFIEVRSKRQMLNDRREQREKEIKAKSKDLKVKDHVTRKPRPPVKSAVQGDGVSAVSHRVAAPLGVERRCSATSTVVISESAPFDGRNLPSAGSSASFVASVLPQPLAPIGTPVLGADSSNDKRLTSTKPIQTSSVLVMPQGDADPATGLTFENQNLGHDNIPSTTVGAWGGTRTNHQVVSLTQIQLEEAMKPVCYESARTPLLPLGDCGSMVLEPGIRVSSMLAQDKPLSSMLAQDKPLSSGAVPLNSLLAGETIQFGAVTSPTLFPPGSCPLTPAVSIAIGTAVASRSDGSVESNLSAPESDSTIFFKGKHADDRLRQIVDSEAEAEAAASAVAVAAISTDESVGSGLDGIAISVAETKGFVSLDVSADSAGASSSRPLMIQSRGEDSMTVALPADLSVETPSLSLWPPLPSRQSSAGPVLPHFPGAPSHFPCFEMGPMLGGPIFAFGQHEEVTPLSQGPKCSTSIEQGLSGMGAAPVGGWQQCRSGVDSFYGAPASGFTGPFISPPGGIPGIQGPPHMLVYTNPFAPVGQFGQLGLSFMGTAYIPSGKQPDWKHTPVSTSGVGLNEGDASSLGMMSAQRNPNVPTVQHMAPGSSMMPIVPPLGLFDMNLSSPFQSSADLSMQTQWSHVPGPPLHSMPASGPLVGLSMPLQQGDGLSTQFSHPSHTMESTGSRFHQVLSSKTTGSGSFSSVDAAAQFPDELGLGDSVSNNNSSVHLSQNLSSSRTNAYNSASSANIKVQKAKASSRPARSSSSGSGSESSGMALGTSTATSSSQSLHGSRTVGSPFHSQGGVQQTSAGQYPHPIGYSEQRGTAQQQTGQKAVVANEWSGQSHRKIGGQGRSQVSGDKNFATSKMKQVYVVKPTSSSSNVGTAVTLP